MDSQKKRVFSKDGRLGQLEERMEYLEGVMYKLFALTEQLLTRLEKIDHTITESPSRTDRLLPLMTVFTYS